MRDRFILSFIIFLFFSCTVVGVLTYVPDREVKRVFQEIFLTFEQTSKLTIIVAGSVLVLALIGGALLAGWIAYSAGVIWWYSGKTKQAEWLQKIREAALVVSIAPPGSQVYLTEVTGQLPVVTKPLHLLPGFINGKQTEYSLNEERRWSFFQLAQSINKPDKNIIENALPQIGAPLPDYVDLSHYVSNQTSLRNIFLGVGRYQDGRVQPVSAPLSHLVHVAVAGSSGFGKSVFMAGLGYQVLNARENCEPTFLDAQAVTFTSFTGHERLRYPIASEEKEIQAVLIDLADELKHRKELFSKWKAVDSLEKYNSVADEPLPVLPVFFDEFGLVAGNKEIAKLVDLLAKGGRKFGLYLLASSQTWYSSEIATTLRANLSTSVQFYSRDKSQSRVLLGDSAAASITRKGQAFCRLPGQTGLIELQAPDCSTLIDVTPMLLEVNEDQKIMPTILPTEEEQLIIDLHQQGKSYREISQAVFGEGKYGNFWNEKIKEVLHKFGE